MKVPLFWQVISVLCLCAILLYAGQVRDLHTNDENIKTIHLSMGQSTILRFKERPKKIVVGNANYVHIEFIENDLAIQPLQPVTTNLFVYAPFGRTYGFKLKVGTSDHYDDLVNVKWKAKGKIRLAKKKILKRQEKHLNKKAKNKLTLSFDKILIRVESVSKHKTLNLHFMDLKIKNVSDSSLNLKPLKIKINQKGKLLFSQVVVDSYSLKKGTSTKARVILRLTANEQQSFTLQLSFHQESRKVQIIPKSNQL